MMLSAAALMALSLVGCGGNGDSDNGVEKVISEAETLDKADLYKKSHGRN